MKKRNLKAFTLAEVLIALTIIGVVAALTIPALVNNTNQKEIVTALKKAHSDLSRAFMLAQNDHGPISSWGLTENGIVNHTKFAEILMPYFNLVKICPANDSKGSCFFQAAGKYKYLNGGTWINSSPHPIASAVGANGFIFSFEVFSSCGTDTSAKYGSGLINQGICGDIFVDINGAKKPNVLGKDVFSFYVSDDGLAPRGLPGNEEGTQNLAKFSTDCANSGSLGYACAGWVIYNENMDYLNCTGLSWDGRRKCSN